MIFFANLIVFCHLFQAIIVASGLWFTALCWCWRVRWWS